MIWFPDHENKPCSNPESKREPGMCLIVLIALLESGQEGEP